MKNLIKSIVFITLFCIIWHFTFTFLWIEKNSTSLFYEEPQNTMDIVYFGPSNAYLHFNTVLAYNKYGFTTGMISADGQPIAAIKYLINESKKYQKPNLYIIDITTDIYSKSYYSDGEIRMTLDSMKFNKNRIDAINDVLKYRNTDKSEYIEYYFSFLKYHNMWKDIINKDLYQSDPKDYKNLFKGYLFGDFTNKISESKYIKWSNITGNYYKDNKRILQNLIKFIKSNNLNVLFVIPRRYFDKNDYINLNEAESLINKNNLNIINFNKLDDFDVDFSKDFRDARHLNVYGATKNTLYFAKYLKDNYDLKDHRNDEKYKSWNEEYERFKESFNSITGENFNKVLDNINY